MNLTTLLTAATLVTSTGLALADEEAPVIDRSISRQQAQEVVRHLFRRLCSLDSDCGIGVEKPSADCPFVFIVIVPFAEPTTGARTSVAIWTSLDHRGRVMAISESREGACVST